jgi:hypothetical protein
MDVWCRRSFAAPDCCDCKFETRWENEFSSVFVVCCVGRGGCDGLITCPEEPYWIYVCLCVVWEVQQWGGTGLSWADVPPSPK